MTVATAFEHVRSIRPRVLLHQSQRKVVYETDPEAEKVDLFVCGFFITKYMIFVSDRLLFSCVTRLSRNLKGYNLL